LLKSSCWRWCYLCN